MQIQRIIPFLLTVISVVLLSLSFFIEDQKVSDFSSAAFLPAVTAAIMVVCALLIVKRGVAAPIDHRKIGEDENTDLVENEQITRQQLSIRILLFLLAVIFFAVLMNYLNFMLVSFLFLFLSMYMLSRRKLAMPFIVSLTVSVSFYYLFSSVFKIVFPT